MCHGRTSHCRVGLSHRYQQAACACVIILHLLLLDVTHVSLLSMNLTPTQGPLPKQVQSDFFSPDDDGDGGAAAAPAGVQSVDDAASDDGLADDSGSDEEVRKGAVWFRRVPSA